MDITKEADLSRFRIREIRVEAAGPSWAEGDCYTILHPGMIVEVAPTATGLQYVVIEKLSYAANVAGCTWAGRMLGVDDLVLARAFTPAPPAEEDIEAAVRSAARILEETA